MISELKKAIEDAEAYRNQVWLEVELPTDTGAETISFRAKNVVARDGLMHAFRRAGITASFATMVDRVYNIDNPNREKPFWGTKRVSILKS